MEDKSASSAGITLDELLAGYEDVDYSDVHVSHLIEGEYNFEGRAFSRISTAITARDRIHAIMVRTGYKRDQLTVPTGIYAIGSPGARSHVIVTGNYKLTFDAVRKSLGGRSAWLLVIDSKGINVWCAAGKGTFGTRELVQKVISLSLDKVVKGRKLILPQLGASSMEPHIVKRLTRFKVIYGPVRAEDLGGYIDSDCVADEGMRKATFTLGERIVLVHNEFISSLANALIAGTAAGLALGIHVWMAIASAFMGAVFGNYVFVALLPLRPFKSFALSGHLFSVPLYAATYALLSRAGVSPLGAMALVFIQGAFVSWYTFNFTGSTTFTSLSGVRVEGKYAFSSTFILAFLAASMAGLSRALGW